VARRGDPVAFFHVVKAGLLLELLSEFLAARFEELDVADAVSLHVPFQMEGVVIVDLVGIPALEFGFFLGGHTVRIVAGGWRHGSPVLLVL